MDNATVQDLIDILKPIANYKLETAAISIRTTYKQPSGNDVVQILHGEGSDIIKLILALTSSLSKGGEDNDGENSRHN